MNILQEISPGAIADVLTPLGAGSLAKTLVDGIRTGWPEMPSWAKITGAAIITIILVIATEAMQEPVWGQRQIAVTVIKIFTGFVYALAQTTVHNNARKEG